MQQQVKLTNEIFWVGVNDRHTERFENFWPLPFGVSYNSYLVIDQKTALIDTVEIGFIEEYLQKIRNILEDREIDYLIVNHMEPDHSGSINALLRQYPNMKIIGNAKTIPMLSGYYNVEAKSIVVEESETLSLGKHTLQFFTIPMVHWPESMVTYEVSKNILFSNDAFGSFGTLDGGIFDFETEIDYYTNEMRRYYSNIVGKYGLPVQKALAKLKNITIKMIAPSHGLIWRDKISDVLSYYDKWSRCEAEDGAVIIYGTLYGNTGRMADIIARSIAEEGIRKIRIFDASKTHLSYLINEIWKYKGVMLGSSAYNGGIFTPMGTLTDTLMHIMPQNRILGIFGSMSWGGGGVRKLEEFAQHIRWQLIAPPIEIKHAINKDNIEDLVSLGKTLAQKLKER